MVVFSGEGVDPTVMRYSDVPNMIPETEKNSAASHLCFDFFSMRVVGLPRYKRKRRSSLFYDERQAFFESGWLGTAPDVTCTMGNICTQMYNYKYKCDNILSFVPVNASEVFV